MAQEVNQGNGELATGNSVITDSDNSNVLTFTDPDSLILNSKFYILNSLCPPPILDCSGYLSERAIANSPIIQEIEDKIILVEKQIDYLDEKVAYYKSRNWTDYITIEPVKFVQNIFGGGDVQKTQLTITDLEIKADRLKIELINLEKEKVVKEEEIKLSVVEYLDKLQELQSKIQLLRKQQDNFEISRSAFLIKYQNGEGTTNQYLSYQDKGEKLEFQLLQLQNDFRQTLNKLSLILGETIPENTSIGISKTP